jgi:peptidoglycan LD-endopeptidase LytH
VEIIIKMNKYIKIPFGFVTILLLSVLLLNHQESEAQTGNTRLIELCNSFNALNTKIRDNKINKPQAKDRIRKLAAEIKGEYYSSGGNNYTVKEWVFPLKGYGYKAIGGVNGNGYQKGGYNFFDGNRHSGHPSLDIFIRDKKQASLDDATKQPVRVLSVSGGVVVAVEKDWETTSALRGGKYIWILDPTSDALIYYAHNSRIMVEVGDMIKPGDVIAEVGRTGLNAYKKRSPTHLHLTYLQFINGSPAPKNIYQELLTSKLL